MTHTKKKMFQRLLKGHEAVLLKHISVETFLFFLSIFTLKIKGHNSWILDPPCYVKGILNSYDLSIDLTDSLDSDMTNMTICQNHSKQQLFHP